MKYIIGGFYEKYKKSCFISFFAGFVMSSGTIKTGFWSYLGFGVASVVTVGAGIGGAIIYQGSVDCNSVSDDNYRHLNSGNCSNTFDSESHGCGYCKSFALGVDTAKTMKNFGYGLTGGSLTFGSVVAVTAKIYLSRRVKSDFGDI